MVIGIIQIVLSGIILCSEIIRCQIKKQACAAVIAVKAADDLVKKAFHYQFFDHDPCPDAQAAAPGIPSLILRQFGVRKQSRLQMPDFQRFPGVKYTMSLGYFLKKGFFGTV